MASVLYGGIVTGLAGRVGGQNFQRGLATPSLRNISAKRCFIKVLPIGNAIADIRGAFKYVTSFWASLSPTQQAAWASVAVEFPRRNKFGVSYTPSAYQLFVEFSLALVYIGRSIIVTPPTTSDFVTPTWAVTYAGGGGSIYITQSLVFTAAPYHTVIRACCYQSNGRALIRSRLKVLTAYLFTVIDNSLDISSFFYNTFGSVQQGTTVFFSVNQINVSTGEEDIFNILTLQF